MPLVRRAREASQHLGQLGAALFRGEDVGPGFQFENVNGFDKVVDHHLAAKDVVHVVEERLQVEFLDAELAHCGLKVGERDLAGLVGKTQKEAPPVGGAALLGRRGKAFIQSRLDSAEVFCGQSRLDHVRFPRPPHLYRSVARLFQRSAGVLRGAVAAHEDDEVVDRDKTRCIRIEAFPEAPQVFFRRVQVQSRESRPHHLDKLRKVQFESQAVKLFEYLVPIAARAVPLVRPIIHLRDQESAVLVGKVGPRGEPCAVHKRGERICRDVPDLFTVDSPPERAQLVP
mmetsp:Transcript_29852/g.100535  ORF Transcript_29852/g.100535 Transcript_29852/m.100535 type:complete len:286 (+) Transcript_29852:2004-2861(+)